MSRKSLYKYYSQRKWAEEFLDGKLLFRSLAYFRDHEDEGIRGDQNEGTTVYRPKGGLIINNLTRGTTFTLPQHAFESSANQEEIFVFCLSRSLKDYLREKFEAVVCVEILNIGTFCARVAAALPPEATFPEERGRARLGHRVTYYPQTEASNPRRALPGAIATAKSNVYAWQDEFRLVFCLTDALEFEKVGTRLVQNSNSTTPNTAEHHDYPVNAGSLSDICRVHEF